MINLYVDDIRLPPADNTLWTVARTVDAAKVLLSTGDVDACSLDHDLGACDTCIQNQTQMELIAGFPHNPLAWCPHVADGTALVRWMVETGTWSKRKPTVHSANYSGRLRMCSIIEQFFALPAQGPMF